MNLARYLLLVLPADLAREYAFAFAFAYGYKEARTPNIDRLAARRLAARLETMVRCVLMSTGSETAR
ncbi:MAG: hypothetical protein ACR2PG_14855 [Hyphomicrobiaceae bacterium]